MLKSFESDEMEVATKLIFDGLSMAKASMEMILQSPITLKKVSYGEKVGDSPVIDYQSDQAVQVIKTELKGELRGTSHLIFSEEDVARVCAACLPPVVLESDSAQNQMMKTGFLTEIDNMVAAAVITEFANFLGVDIFGHVPSLQIMKAEEVNQYLANEATEFDSMVHFKALFHGDELNISPDFIWIFQNDLVDRIKQKL